MKFLFDLFYVNIVYDNKLRTYFFSACQMILYRWTFYGSGTLNQ